MTQGRRYPRSTVVKKPGDNFTWQISDLSPIHHWTGQDYVGSPVTSAPDQGSGGRDLSNNAGSVTVASVASLGGRDAFQFNDSNLVNIFIDQGTAYTLSLVGSFNGINGGDGWLVDTNGGKTMIRVDWNSGTPGLWCWQNSGFSFGFQFQGFTAADDTSYLIQVYFNGTSSLCWVNNVSYTLDASTFAWANWNAPTIGANAGGTGADWNAAEIVVTPGPMSADDRANFNEWRVRNAA